MDTGLVLLLLGGFLLGGTWSVWSVDEDSPRRSTPQIVFAAILLVAALLASASGILRMV